MLFIIILFYDIFNILLIRIIVISHVNSFYRTHLNMDLSFFFLIYVLI